MRICSLYGAGFYYIPGTDTCIKLGGYLRAETAFNSTHLQRRLRRTVGRTQPPDELLLHSRSRQDLTVDTRTATEYGVVRTFFDAIFTWTSGTYAGSRHGWYHVQRGGRPGLATPLTAASLAARVGIYYAFIQFAGFTMGKTVSAFDAPWVNYPANNFDGLVGGSGSINGVNQFTYTASSATACRAPSRLRTRSRIMQTGV